MTVVILDIFWKEKMWKTKNVQGWHTVRLQNIEMALNKEVADDRLLCRPMCCCT